MNDKPIFEPEPDQFWKRMDFNMENLHGKDFRGRAEMETNRDLKKPVEQLLCDFHDMAELVIQNASPEERMSVQWYMLHAQKRMVGMMAKVTLSNDILSKRILWLTIAAIVLAVAQVFLSVIQILVSLCQH